jgi:serine/threonine protein kinase
VKLSDFGLSKKMKDNDTTSTQLGTPLTKAPEIWFELGHNAKADLWSIGVIMYQLFFDVLPFPARTVRELKEAIFRASGVRLPKGEEDSMTQICFDLIDKLLQKDPKRRIDFDDYFKHKFFSEEHKKNLMDKIKNNIKNEKVVYNEYKEENTIKEEKSEDDSDKDSNYSDKEKKIYKIDDKNNDFEKRFIKKLLIKEHKD